MFEKSNVEVLEEQPEDNQSEKESAAVDILNKINKGLGKPSDIAVNNKGRTERPQVIKFDKKKITLVPNLGSSNVTPHCPPKIKTKNLKLVKNPTNVVAVKNLFYGHTEENESGRPVPERVMPDPGLHKNKSQGLGIQTINAQKREASDYYPAQTSNEWKVPGNKMQTISGGAGVQSEAKFSKNTKARTNRAPGGFYKEVVPIKKDAKDEDSDWDDDDEEEITDDQA